MEGVDDAIAAILQSARAAVQAADLKEGIFKNTIVGLGLAGINLPDRLTAMRRWPHPFEDLFITGDQYVACLGAHQGADGAVIITGTGSCGISNVDGMIREYGGHGFPLGDKGGGAWMGLKALQHSLRSENNLGRQSILTEMFQDWFKETNNTHIVSRMARAKPFEYARLAPIVFAAAEQNDDVALEIIQDGAAYISRMAREILKTSPPRLSILGGLGPRLQLWLDKEVSSHMQKPLDNAEVGAILYARLRLDLKKGCCEEVSI
jgi:glucosamine kinase